MVRIHCIQNHLVESCRVPFVSKKTSAFLFKDSNVHIDMETNVNFIEFIETILMF